MVLANKFWQPLYLHQVAEVQWQVILGWLKMGVPGVIESKSVCAFLSKVGEAASITAAAPKTGLAVALVSENFEVGLYGRLKQGGTRRAIAAAREAGSGGTDTAVSIEYVRSSHLKKHWAGCNSSSQGGNTLTI
jgi:hypothetical protein